MLVKSDVKVQGKANSCMLIIRENKFLYARCFHKTALAAHKWPAVVRACKSTHTAEAVITTYAVLNHDGLSKTKDLNIAKNRFEPFRARDLKTLQQKTCFLY